MPVTAKPTIIDQNRSMPVKAPSPVKPPPMGASMSPSTHEVTRYSAGMDRIAVFRKPLYKAPLIDWPAPSRNNSVPILDVMMQAQETTHVTLIHLVKSANHRKCARQGQ